MYTQRKIADIRKCAFRHDQKGNKVSYFKKAFKEL